MYRQAQGHREARRQDQRGDTSVMPFPSRLAAFSRSTVITVGEGSADGTALAVGESRVHGRTSPEAGGVTKDSDFPV